MASFLLLAALAFAEESASLPDPLRALAHTADAFADSVARLDKETHVVLADAALVHNVSSNKTTREAVFKYMGDELRAGMPSTRAAEDAEENARKAATAYAKADLTCKAKRAQVAVLRERQGKANLTSTEAAELQKVSKASQSANAECTAAKAELEKKVATAEKENAALLEATRKYASSFKARVDELMQAARSREAAAKAAMGAATAEGQAAARAAVHSRELDEQKGEGDELKAELWAEGHERVIEHASDHASDDLERIYAPVKDLAHKTLHAAEHEAEKRQSLVQGDKSDSDDPKALPPVPGWVAWAAGLALAAL